MKLFIFPPFIIPEVLFYGVTGMPGSAGVSMAGVNVVLRV